MAIQLRRGNEADLDITRLLPGEMAVCLDSGKIIVKLTGGNYLALTDSAELLEAIDGKADASHTHALSDVTGLAEALSGKANASHTHAQSDVTGFAAALDGKANTNHTHAQSDIIGLAEALSGNVNASHTHPDMTGATSDTGGTSGFVPAPAAGDHMKYLKGDGTWGAPAGAEYSPATPGSDGLMSGADKTKLNGCKVIVTCTQAEYEALAAPDANTVYLIPEASA